MMGVVSAWDRSAASTILIDAEPAKVLDAVAGLPGRPAQDSVAAVQRVPGAAGRPRPGDGGLLEAAGHQVAGARGAGQRRSRGSHRHREGRQLLDGDQLDRGPGRVAGSSVTVKTTWNGADGVAGFFEKTFAPLGLRRIQDEVLANLKTEVERS